MYNRLGATAKAAVGLEIPRQIFELRQRWPHRDDRQADVVEVDRLGIVQRDRNPPMRPSMLPSARPLSPRSRPEDTRRQRYKLDPPFPPTATRPPRHRS